MVEGFDVASKPQHTFFFALEMSNLLSLVFTSHLSGYDADVCSWFLVQHLKLKKQMEKNNTSELQNG